MPPPPKGIQNQTKKKKNKGRPPAHQNKFAFKHNPKSKLTEKILSSPNIHVCQRCYDKIEWRKQYRKYKPLTQPGTCNGCRKRNVVAAYHTICLNCTTESAKAKELIHEEIERLNNKKQNQEAESLNDENVEQETTTEEDKKDDDVPTSDTSHSHSHSILRACAVCVKEIALPDPDEGDENDLTEGVGRLKLRERKAIERQLAKEAQNRKKKSKSSTEGEEDEEDRSSNSDDDDDDADAESVASSVILNDGDNSHDDEFDEDDPFLKAIGGADQFVTGEAYQQKLLRQQQQQLKQEQTSS
jgi:hypothetical protein